MEAESDKPGVERYRGIELVAVGAFLCVLAAAGAPLLHSLVRRGRVVEATQSLRAIRFYEGKYHDRRGRYLPVAAGHISLPPTDANAPGLELDFSDNAYFGDACFSVDLHEQYGYIARCDGDAPNNKAPHASRAAGIVVELRGSDAKTRYSLDSEEFTPWRQRSAGP